MLSLGSWLDLVFSYEFGSGLGKVWLVLAFRVKLSDRVGVKLMECCIRIRIILRFGFVLVSG